MGGDSTLRANVLIRRRQLWTEVDMCLLPPLEKMRTAKTGPALIVCTVKVYYLKLDRYRVFLRYSLYVCSKGTSIHS